MKFEEYASKVLKTTEESYVGFELDLRFDIREFIMEKLSSLPMTQANLARKLKMKPSQLNRILKAESNLTLETIARIFHAFNCRPTIREGTQLVEAVGTEKVSIRQTVLYQTAKVRSART